MSEQTVSQFVAEAVTLYDRAIQAFPADAALLSNLRAIAAGRWTREDALLTTVQPDGLTPTVATLWKCAENLCFMARQGEEGVNTPSSLLVDHLAYVREDLDEMGF